MVFDIAIPNGMKLSEDTKIVEFIKKGLKKKGGYCPCLLDKNENTKCPCKDVRETYECRCGLFIKK
jgi:ferredoxin-thioredoxin reductase catalytic subunit